MPGQRELGADLNSGKVIGNNYSLMAAQLGNHEDVAKSWLTMKADPQLCTTATPGEPRTHSALSLAKDMGASPEQVDFLELYTHCANPDCEGRGLKKYKRCKWLRYCSVDCQRAHWSSHKPECKAPVPKKKTTKKQKDTEKKTTAEAAGVHLNLIGL